MIVNVKNNKYFGLTKKYHILLIWLNIKKIVALKIDGVNDAINENIIRNKLVIKKDSISLHFNLFKMNSTTNENILMWRPDNANKWVIPFIL